MKLGLLADIHEAVENLSTALDLFAEQGVEQVVVLGDVFETGQRIAETTRLLADVGAIGVWGNHDFGLCQDVTDEVRGRYQGIVIEFMERLRPRLDFDDLLFQHNEPWLDPTRLEDLWYFNGAPQSAADLARGFAAGSHRISFHGHYHQWLLGSPEGVQAWTGSDPVSLSGPGRFLVVVNAVFSGHCALYDTESSCLTPCSFGQQSLT